jgi:hypothetical protein
MVIKASASAEVRALVGALEGDDDVAREAAIARLSIIGARAVDRLATAYEGATSRGARLAILRVFEAIGDYRAGPLARRALLEGGDTALAASAVLRTLLTSTRDATAAQALDALVATALDTSNDHRLRLAAVEALRDAPGDVGARVAEAVGADAGTTDAGAAEMDVARRDAVWRDAVEDRLPDDPRVLREALSERAAAAPLNTLRRMIDAAKARETETPPGSRDGWRSLRGALHQALALRGSRVALYDLRESLAGDTRAVPPSFLAALHVIGDESCLEPLAGLWERSAHDERWRHQLASAFRAIVRRERISPRHRIVVRLKARGSGLVA